MQLHHKFDIAYFTAIEKISFCKYPRLCVLEARHGDDIGKSYTNDVARLSSITLLNHSI